MEITDGQSWPNYIGPKRDIPQVCLINQTSVYTLSPEGGVVWNLPYMAKRESLHNGAGPHANAHAPLQSINIVVFKNSLLDLLRIDSSKCRLICLIFPFSVISL